jgi:uncharacterized protein (DUF1697 family)
MDALRVLYETMGFDNIATYVQSGNVIFTSKKTNVHQLAQSITLNIEKEFGYKVPALVFTIDTLKSIINTNPFIKNSKLDSAFLHVTFLSSTPDKSNLNVIEEKINGEEQIFISENAVYLYCPHGYGHTKLTNTFLEAKLKVTATTRNWKTVHMLLAMTEPKS